VTDRSHWKVRKYKVGDEPPVDEDILQMTPGERLEAQWEITKALWTWQSGTLDEPPFRRDVARVIRRER
jgi:hypothetical protein